MGYLPEKVIEIGCGAGGILKAFQNMGCKTLGIDFNQKYLDFGIANGLDLRLGGTGVLKDYTADLVILSHVVEHFSDLNKELSAIGNLLKASGHLYVEVPGVFNLRPYSFDFLRSLQNAHNYYFTLGTLTQVMAKYSWSLKYGDERVRSLFILTNKKDDISQNHYFVTMHKLNQYERIRPLLRPQLSSLMNNLLWLIDI